MTHTIGEVARLAHVSVRTLHHYDDLGLLVPSDRSDAGYRLYTTRDLERLQQVLFYKELGFGLEEIRKIMADPDFDRREALESQRQLVAEQATRLEALLGLIDRTLDSLKGGVRLTKEEMFEVFGDFDPAEYDEEAKDRWGDTDAYKESARRTARYTKQDWARYKEEAEKVTATIAALMDEGVPPSDVRATHAVEENRLLIDRWFYPCSRQMHAALGQMYVGDHRFAQHYEKIRSGMARYICDAIEASLDLKD